MSTRRSTVLERILAETRAEVARRKREAPLAGRSASVPATRRRPGRALPRRAAPRRDRRDRRVQAPLALGRARCATAPTSPQIVGAYERGGAVALSVLTEGPELRRLAGGPARGAREPCALPLLRKDFIVDPYQLHEARRGGRRRGAADRRRARRPRARLAARAGARARPRRARRGPRPRRAAPRARARARSSSAINNRDLRDFSVDVERTEALLGEIPPGVTVVSESGIATPAQLRAAAGARRHGGARRRVADARGGSRPRRSTALLARRLQPDLRRMPFRSAASDRDRRRSSCSSQ